MLPKSPESSFQSQAPTRELVKQPQCSRFLNCHLRIGLETCSALFFESRLSLPQVEAVWLIHPIPSLGKGRIPCCQTLCPHGLLCPRWSSSKCRSCSERSRKGLLSSGRRGQHNLACFPLSLARLYFLHRWHCALWCTLKEGCCFLAEYILSKRRLVVFNIQMYWYTQQELFIFVSYILEKQHVCLVRTFWV